jgi:POT family proton-dependent oligopeptide transporter
MSEAAAPAVDQPQLFGHPRGLATLFLTEVGERFTYYGMRAILILFMVGAIANGGLGLDDRTANAIYGLPSIHLSALCSAADR